VARAGADDLGGVPGRGISGGGRSRGVEEARAHVEQGRDLAADVSRGGGGGIRSWRRRRIRSWWC
jgi:hypothetical protein